MVRAELKQAEQIMGMGIGMAPLPAAGPISGLTKDRLTVYRVSGTDTDGEEHIHVKSIDHQQ